MKYQEKFNDVIQKNVPSHVSLAQEISEILNVSLDSAYRRLRNQTEYSFSEAMKVTFHFDIPLEAFNLEQGTAATFKINHMNKEVDSYRDYINSMLHNIKRLATFKDAQFFFAAEDIPVYYHFCKPTLTRFKIIYWLKSNLNVKDFQYKTFENIEIPQDIIETAEKIYTQFEKVNSTEIWTSETIQSTLLQVKFYYI